MGSKRRSDPVEVGGTTDSGDSSNDEEETPMYKCKKCDDKLLTAEELVEHRKWHKETKRARQEAAETTKDPRSPRRESAAPGPSRQGGPSSPRRRKKGQRKIRPVKVYDNSIMPTKSNGA